MAYQLRELPYAKDALTPHLSNETLNYHYDKHHAGYVAKLNKAAEGQAWAGQPLEELMRTQKGGVFNNAAQVYNHDFYWLSMSPDGGGQPSGQLADAIKAQFGSFDDFKKKFSASAGGHFGSGWVWLVRGADGKLAIEETHDAQSVLPEGERRPLLTCDVWEHAYYIDRRNDRPAYVEAWWNVVNWEFAAKNFAG